MNAKKRREVAYHEAGHAAAAVRLSVKIKKASIIPDADGLSLGSVHHPGWGPNMRPDVTVGLKARAALERHIIVCFAGMLAEKRVRGRCNWVGARTDHHAAVELSSYINGSTRTTEKHLAWLRARAELQQGEPGFWVAVEAIAAALLDQDELTGEQVVHLARQAFRKPGLC